MMPHEGDGSCIAREEILHRDGRNVASRRNGECIAMQKKGLFFDGKYVFFISD